MWLLDHLAGTGAVFLKNVYSILQLHYEEESPQRSHAVLMVTINCAVGKGGVNVSGLRAQLLEGMRDFSNITNTMLLLPLLLLLLPQLLILRYE